MGKQWIFNARQKKTCFDNRCSDKVDGLEDNWDRRSQPYSASADVTAPRQNIHAHSSCSAQHATEFGIGLVVRHKTFGVVPLHHEQYRCPLACLHGPDQIIGVSLSTDGRRIWETSHTGFHQCHRFDLQPQRRLIRTGIKAKIEPTVSIWHLSLKAGVVAERGYASSSQRLSNQMTRQP
jgi:hypothetical protein